MNLLAFDTSTEYLTVACLKDNGKGKIRSEAHFFGAMQHGEKIISLIQKALREADLKLENCDAFLIGLGPGSFTGLRVGFATLKGIALSTEKPCYGFSSLDVTVQAASEHEGPAAVLMDAHREKLYLGLYESRAGKITATQAHQCLALDDLVKRLKPLENGLWMSGDALDRYGDQLRKALPKALFAGRDFWYPHSSFLIDLFENEKNHLKPFSVAELVPLYLQEPKIGPAKIYGHTQKRPG